ncbi:Creatine kinase, partial [Durusdinium trenchii]
ERGLGFLTTCPSDLGAAFRAKLRSALPSLGHMTGFKEVTRALGIQAKRVASQDGMWDISLSSNQLDPSMDPTGQVNSLLFAAHHLSALERRLKSGESLDLVAEAEVLKQ